jgi:hypothetical protein
MKVSYILLLSVSAAMQVIATANGHPSTTSASTNTDVEDGSFKRAIESGIVNTSNSDLGQHVEVQMRQSKPPKKSKGKPTAGKGTPAAGKPTAEKPTTEKPVAGKPSAGKDKPAAGKGTAAAKDKPAAGVKPRGCKKTITKLPAKSTGGQKGTGTSGQKGKGTGGQKAKGSKRSYIDFLMLRDAAGTPTSFQTHVARHDA